MGLQSLALQSRTAQWVLPGPKIGEFKTQSINSLDVTASVGFVHSWMV